MSWEWPNGQFTWTAAGAWGSFLMLIGIIVRQVGPWRKISVDAEKDFRDGLLARVERLEQQLDFERAAHAGEMSFNRHRLNNVTQCFDALLMLLEANPDKAAEAVVMIKEMRAAQLEAEAKEAAIYHSAKMQATAPLQ